MIKQALGVSQFTLPVKDRCSVCAFRHAEFTSAVMELHRHYELELVHVPILNVLDRRCIYIHIDI